jgi:hypothetical protein
VIAGSTAVAASGGPGVLDPSPADADRIARHLIGEAPSEAEAARWIEAVRRRAAPLATARDRRLWELAMRHPWRIGLVDAGLALVDPHSPVRHRLFLMLAILEASPRHCARFLPASHSRAALAALALRGVAAALRGAAGWALVRTCGVLWR